MTDFDDWYARKSPYITCLGDISDAMRKAYEAGAASQAGTLRDKFAGQALSSYKAAKSATLMNRAELAYLIADAMLEARKTTGEGEA
jgi:hypothetical protein